MLKPYLILLLGGVGNRFGSKVPKQFLPFLGKTLLFEYTTELFLKEGIVQNVLFVIHKAFLHTKLIHSSIERLQKKYTKVNFFKIKGSTERHYSLENAVSFLDENQIKNISLMIHDANRPYLSKNFLKRIKNLLKDVSSQKPCWIPVVPITSSLVSLDNIHNEIRYLNRDCVFSVQTPQIIEYESLYNAFSAKKDSSKKQVWTDEGSFMQDMGYLIKYFEGDNANIKITYSSDMVN